MWMFSNVHIAQQATFRTATFPDLTPQHCCMQPRSTTRLTHSCQAVAGTVVLP